MEHHLYGLPVKLLLQVFKYVTVYVSPRYNTESEIVTVSIVLFLRLYAQSFHY